MLVTAGMTYFIKGSGSAFSNFGSGDFHFFLTGGKQIFDYGHWLSATGFRIPGNSNWGTQMWYWSNQWDYEVFDGIYALGGINWFHWMSNAGYNLGSSGHRARHPQYSNPGRGGQERRLGRRRRQVEAQSPLRNGNRFRIPAHRPKPTF